MTVSQLMQILQGYPGNARVVVNGYEEGYDDLSPGQLSLVKVVLNTGKNRWRGNTVTRRVWLGKRLPTLR